MDPNANLLEQEEILRKLRASLGDASRRRAMGPDAPFEAYNRRSLKSELAGFRRALREWLDGGGFAPDWTRAPFATKYFEKFLVRRVR